MSRRGAIPKREILSDPVYKSQTVSKFINVLMKDGKKSTAEKIVYGAFDLIGERSEKRHAPPLVFSGNIPCKIRPIICFFTVS